MRRLKTRRSENHKRNAMFLGKNKPSALFSGGKCEPAWSLLGRWVSVSYPISRMLTTLKKSRLSFLERTSQIHFSQKENSNQLDPCQECFRFKPTIKEFEYFEAMVIVKKLRKCCWEEPARYSFSKGIVQDELGSSPDQTPTPRDPLCHPVPTCVASMALANNNYYLLH